MRVFVVLAAIASLSACEPMPIPVTYPLSSQQKMQSVAHWQVLADEFAQEMAASVGTGMPVYVAPTGVSPFARGVDAYLETALFKAGYAMASGPQGAVTVAIGAQRVEHYGRRDYHIPGIFTAAGVSAVIANQNITEGDMVGAAIPLGIGLDLLSGAVATPTNTELIVTAEARSAARILFRDTKSFYLPDGDRFNYPLMASVSWMGTPLEAHTVRVDP